MLGYVRATEVGAMGNRIGTLKMLRVVACSAIGIGLGINGVHSAVSDTSIAVLKAMAGSQVVRLQALLMNLAEGENTSSGRNDWRQLAEHCKDRQGNVGARVRYDRNVKANAMRFVCEKDGRYWASPWYWGEDHQPGLKNQLGRFFLGRYGRGIVLWDWYIAGATPAIDLKSDVSYEASRGVVEKEQIAIVSPEAIEEALRRWIAQSLQHAQIRNQGKAAVGKAHVMLDEFRGGSTVVEESGGEGWDEFGLKGRSFSETLMQEKRAK